MMNNSKLSIFGASLYQLLFREGRMEDITVPIWIDSVCSKLRYKDTLVDNLWATGGPINEMGKLLEDLALRPDISVVPYSVQSVARLLFVYFKKVPVPLLSLELHDYFIGASYPEIFENAADRVVYIRKLVETLPRANSNALHALMRVFTKIWADNYKDTQNATVDLWGPVLLCRSNVHDVAREIPAACRLLRFMIENYATMFPQQYQQQIAGGSPLTGASAPKLEERKSTKALLTTLETPIWLLRFNNYKVVTMKKYLNQVSNLAACFDQWCIDADLKAPEFQASLGLLNEKLSALIDSIESNRNLIQQIIDTQHLERFYSYLLDFQATCRRDIKLKKFFRHFVSRRLRGGLERLSLAMQYEMVLFFNTFDSLFEGRISSDPKYKKKFRVHTIDLIKDEEGHELWRDKFGTDAFIVEMERFLEVYNEAVGGGIDPELSAHLRDVLDDSSTGFVSVYNFAQFLKAFGPLGASKQNTQTTIKAPWFHGYVSREEAPRMLEPYPEGTFLIRFSGSDPGSFAINCKLENKKILAIKIDTDENHTFLVREGGQDDKYRVFPTIPDIVQFYGYLLTTPLKEKFAFKQWFFGDLQTDDIEEYMSFESPGTFLIRFSGQVNFFTCSYIDASGKLNQARIGRYPSGEITFDNFVYQDIDQFVQSHSKWFLAPFRNDNHVSSTQEGDDWRRRQLTAESVIEDEEGAGADDMTLADQVTKAPSAGGLSSPALGGLGGLGLQRRTSAALALHAHSRKLQPLAKESDEDVLTNLLTKAATAVTLELDDEVKLADYLFRVTPDLCDKVQKKVHKKVVQTITGKDKLPVFSAYSVNKKGLILNKEITEEIKITNKMKDTIGYTLIGAPAITSQFFLAASPSAFVIDAGATVKVRITIVLFKPIELREVINFRFESANANFRMTIALPVRAAVSKDCLLGTAKIPEFWVPEILDQPGEVTAVLGRELGGGATAKVHICDLYGANVAVKLWEMGKLDEPQEEFWAELNTCKTLRHENLVGFVGAVGRTGRALLILELLDGSMEKILNIWNSGLYPDGDHRAKCAVEIKDRLRLAIDSAKGLLYLHDRNVIHRDIKSLNFLVKKDSMQSKVADFGESEARDKAATSFAGTDMWMAPEAYNDSVNTSKSDVFAFGLVLQEMLTQLAPLRDLKMVQAGVIRPTEDEFKTAHPEWCNLIQQCCRYFPEKRPTMFSVLRQLEALQDKYELRKTARPTKVKR